MLDDIISMAFELLGMFMAAGILIAALILASVAVTLFFGLY